MPCGIRPIRLDSPNTHYILIQSRSSILFHFAVFFLFVANTQKKIPKQWLRSLLITQKKYVSTSGTKPIPFLFVVQQQQKLSAFFYPNMAEPHIRRQGRRQSWACMTTRGKEGHKPKTWTFEQSVKHKVLSAEKHAVPDRFEALRVTPLLACALWVIS